MKFDCYLLSITSGNSRVVQQCDHSCVDSVQNLRVSILFPEGAQSVEHLLAGKGRDINYDFQSRRCLTALGKKETKNTNVFAAAIIVIAVLFFLSEAPRTVNVAPRRSCSTRQAL